MKDVKYYKEGAHNFMVLVCSGQEEKSYQQKMLERQKLPHIFSCKIRYINGEAFYYYDITSKVNMRNLHHGKEWNLSMIEKLLKDYEAALDELDSFLLEQDKLVLDPEYIYYDYGSGNYMFLFYPDVQKEDNIYEALFDFWVEHLDNQDAAAVDCVYKMYEEAENCCLGIGRIKELLENAADHAANSASNMEASPGAGSSARNFAQASSYGNSPAKGKGSAASKNGAAAGMGAPGIAAGAGASAQESSFSLYESSSEVSDGISQERGKSAPGTAFYMIFLILTILGELGVGAVWFLFNCSESETLILLAAAVVMACLSVCACRLLIKERGVQKRKEKYDQALVEFRENDYGDLPQPVPEKVQMKQFLSVGRKSTQDMKNAYGMQNALGDDNAGETVFFSSDAAFENKLYALDRKNKQHISLEELPVTVGKLKGAVDICLNDSSVSRMHAQIETDGKTYYIKDLNSTNGTFLNGMRLNPNARIEMEPGDEIRFGKLRYSFR